jgi:hypothetical protein
MNALLPALTTTERHASASAISRNKTATKIDNAQLTNNMMSKSVLVDVNLFTVLKDMS